MDVRRKKDRSFSGLGLVQWIALAAAVLTGCSTWEVQHKITPLQRAGAMPAFKPLSANAKTLSAMNNPAVQPKK